MNKQQFRDIKFSLISPMDSLFHLFNYERDDDVFPPWMLDEPGETISNILRIEETEPYIDKIIELYDLEQILEKFITPENPTINDLVLESDKILLLVDISNLIQDEMRNLRIKMCQELNEDKPGYSGKIKFRKFWEELEPMSNDFIDLIKGYLDESFYDIDDDLSYEFAEVICQSIQDICDGLNGKKNNNSNNLKENKNMEEIIKELRCEVNNMDKDFDVDLKNPCKSADTEKKYDKLVNIIKAIIVIMITNINGITKKHIKKKHKRYLFRNINEKIICEESLIFNGQYYDDDSKICRLRYFTLLLIQIFNNIEKLADESYELVEDQYKFLEYEFKTDFVKSIYFRLLEMLEKINNNESISTEKMYFTNLMIYKKSLEKDNYNKGVDKVNKILKQDKVLKFNMEKYPRKNQDILFDTVLKLSQLVCTNKGKLDKHIIPDEKYKFRNKNMNERELSNLGKKIIEKGPSKGMKMYMRSNPCIWSHFKNVNNNSELRAGVIAINYYKFLADNKSIRKRINKIS